MRYFDGHADTLTELDGADETLLHNHHDVDLERVSAFADAYTQVFAIWRDVGTFDPSRMDEVFTTTYDRARAYLRAQQDRIALVTTHDEMVAAHEAGRMAAFLSLEDASFSGSHVDELWDLGIRFVMLAWNYRNQYCCGAACDQAEGLTVEGRRLVRSLASQGIVLDVSHLSDAGAEDLFGLVDVPVIASHSNVRDVWDKPRNLTAWEVDEIIRRRGLIGLNFFAPFVGERPTLDDLLRHADYVLSRGGEDVLCLGGDFDGCDGLFPAGIAGVQSMPALYQAFLNAGFGRELADKVFFDNADRFLAENL